MNNILIFRIAGIITMLVLFTIKARAGIEYNPDRNIVRITDFSESLSCTPEKLLEADRKNGWNKISLVGNNTIAVNAHLMIGADNGTDTFFQLGSKKTPIRKMVIDGDFIIYPTGNASRHNTFRAGYADDASIKTELRIISSRRKPHRIYSGYIPRNLRGGKRFKIINTRFHIANCLVSAAKQDPEHMIDLISLRGNSNHLINSTISWVRKNMTGGMTGALADTVVENTVFEHGGTAIYNFKNTTRVKKIIRNCTFRNCKIAINGNVRLMANFENCVFENNEHDWNLTSYGWLELVDCTFSDPLTKNTYSINKYAMKKKRNTVLTSKRHIIVKVVDEKNNPVKGALVQATCKYVPSPVLAGAKDGKAKLLLTDMTIKTTPVPNKPKVTVYKYNINVEAKGYIPRKLENIRADESLKTIKVIMKKKQ